MTDDYNVKQRSFEIQMKALIDRLTLHGVDSEEYVKTLLCIAVVSVSRLNSIGSANPGSLQPIACRHMAWPVMLPPSNSGFALVVDFLRKIKLGEKPFIPLVTEKFIAKNMEDEPKRRWIFIGLQEIMRLQAEVSAIRQALFGQTTSKFGLAPETNLFERYAMRLVMLGQIGQIPTESLFLKCAMLPEEFRVDERRLWFSALWDWVKWKNAGFPEKNPELRQIGIARGLEKASITLQELEMDVRTGIKPGSEAFEKGVADGIWKSLNQMFKVLTSN